MDSEDEEELFSDWIFDPLSPVIEKPIVKLYDNGAPMLTEPSIVRRVYHLGRIISKAFKELGIFYWTSGGTTLGMVRHGGLIPWDDDLDLCVKDEDEVKLKNCRDLLANNYDLILTEASTFGYRLHHRTESERLPNDELLEHQYPFCDIFIMTRHKKKWILKSRTAKVLWPEEMYFQTEVDGSGPRNFADFQLNCPSNPERYLTHTYGPDWNEIGETQNYDHVQRSSVEQGSFNLQHGHLRPAEPFF